MRRTRGEEDTAAQITDTNVACTLHVHCMVVSVRLCDWRLRVAVEHLRAPSNLGRASPFGATCMPAAGPRDMLRMHLQARLFVVVACAFRMQKATCTGKATCKATGGPSNITDLMHAPSHFSWLAATCERRERQLLWWPACLNRACPWGSTVFFLVQACWLIFHSSNTRHHSAQVAGN